jgi:hypothetical protein
MKKILILFVLTFPLGGLGGFAYAQNIGINTPNPQQKLHVKGNVFMEDNVGIGVLNPEYRLDVNGRMRIRSGGTAFTSAGVWFNNSDNSISPAFMGLYDDSTFGFYGSGGWSLFMDTNNGNVGIGSPPSDNKLYVNGDVAFSGHLGIGVSGTQNSLEVVGNTYLNGVATISDNLLAQNKVIANAIDVTTELKFANTTGKKITIGSAGSNFGLATTVSEFQIYGNNASFGSVKIGFLNPLNGNFISRVTVPNIGSTSIITDGNIISTAFIVSSDARFKTNINTLSNSLENLMSVRGTSYFFRTKEFPQKSFSPTRQLGVIAQEIEDIFPELVTTGEDGYKSVNYIGFIPVIIESIKELKKELNAKTNDIETLKKEMASLKSMVLEIQNVK